MTPLRQRMLEDMQIRHLSPHTQRAYLSAVARFAKHFGRSPAELSLEDIRSYQLHLVSRGIGHSNFTITVSALRFLYTVTLQKDWRVDQIPHARHPQRLPVVLSPTEVSQLLAAAPNLKYRTALTIVYAAGLRVSEVVALKVSDIDSHGMLIRVGQGKGRKDRYVMLSPKLLTLLREYWKTVRPTDWLFPWRSPGQPLNVKNVQYACQDARQAAGLTKPVTVHTLRHYVSSRTMSTTSTSTLIFLSNPRISHDIVGTTLFAPSRAKGVRFEVGHRPLRRPFPTLAGLPGYLSP